MQDEWKGNVRELSNLVERLLILHPNEVIDISDLPAKYRGDQIQDDPVAEREALLEAFTCTDEFDSVDDNFDMDFDESLVASDLDSEQAAQKRAELPDLPVIRDEEDMAQAFIPRLSSDGVNLKDMIMDIEISMIKQALEQTNGVVAKAAETLGLRRTTLIEKMKKYGISAQA